MKYLAVDTSGAHLTVVAVNNEKRHIEFLQDCSVKHSVVLMDAIQKSLQNVNLNVNDCDFFACVVGPGSFTGIRIGVSTVKALSFATNKPCLSVTSFDTIAYNKQNGKVLAVIDAKHQHCYVCGYNNCVVDLSPQYISDKQVEQLQSEYNLFFGEPDCRGQSVSVVEGLIFAIEKNVNNLISPEKLVPLYIRKSQAEENR